MSRLSSGPQASGRTSSGWTCLLVGEDGWPVENRGVAEAAPGLFFCGLSFQYSAASMVIHGVGRDAAYVAARIGRRHAGIRNPDRVEA